MAITALSVTQSIRPASGFGMYCPTPTEYYGVLNGTSASYLSGCVLINNVGTLDEAGTTAPDGSTILGYLTTVGPRRQDMAPQTSGTAPAAAIPGQRTTPSSGAGVYTGNNDPDFGVMYHPALPGMLFTAHMTNGTNNGTDHRADGDADIYRSGAYLRTITSGGANDEVNYATKTGLWVIGIEAASNTNEDVIRTAWYVNPQPTSLSGSSFLNQPGIIVENDATTGTFNPLIIWSPRESAWTQ